MNMGYMLDFIMKNSSIIDKKTLNDNQAQTQQLTQLSPIARYYIYCCELIHFFLNFASNQLYFNGRNKLNIFNQTEFNAEASMGCLSLQVDSIYLGHTPAFRNLCSEHQIQSDSQNSTQYHILSCCDHSFDLGDQPIFDHMMNLTFDPQIFRNC